MKNLKKELNYLKNTPSAALGSVRLHLKDYKTDPATYEKILEVFKKLISLYHDAAKKVKPELSEKFINEKVLIQGAVDLCFIEDNQLVIIYAFLYNH